MTTRRLYPSTVLKFAGMLFMSLILLTIPISIFFLEELQNPTVLFQTILFVIFFSISIGYSHYINTKNRTPIVYHLKIKNINLLPLLMLIIATFIIGLNGPITGMINHLLDHGVNDNPIGSPLIIFGGLLLAPIIEEILFRGILLRGLSSTYSPRVAIIISALIFAIVHLNPAQFFSAIVLGLFLGFIYLKTNSLGMVMLLHFTANFVSLIGGYLSFKMYDSRSNSYFNCYGSNTIYIFCTCAIMCATFCYLLYIKLESIKKFANPQDEDKITEISKQS